jgi:hypothetical protein
MDGWMDGWAGKSKDAGDRMGWVSVERTRGGILLGERVSTIGLPLLAAKTATEGTSASTGWMDGMGKPTGWMDSEMVM